MANDVHGRAIRRGEPTANDAGYVPSFTWIVLLEELPMDRRLRVQGVAVITKVSNVGERRMAVFARELLFVNLAHVGMISTVSVPLRGQEEQGNLVGFGIVQDAMETCNEDIADAGHVVVHGCEGTCPICIRVRVLYSASLSSRRIRCVSIEMR